MNLEHLYAPVADYRHWKLLRDLEAVLESKPFTTMLNQDKIRALQVLITAKAGASAQATISLAQVEKQ